MLTFSSAPAWNNVVELDAMRIWLKDMGCEKLLHWVQSAMVPLY